MVEAVLAVGYQLWLCLFDDLHNETACHRARECIDKNQADTTVDMRGTWSRIGTPPKRQRQ